MPSQSPLSTPLTCGVDVGGTKILGGVVDADGKVLDEVRVDSPATDVDAVAAAIVQVVQVLRARHEFTHVGVGAAGYINRDRSMVLFAPNLAWRDVPLRAQLETTIGLPVIIENDANVAAWGEFRFGAGADASDLLFVGVGTGIGGGIVVDGSLFRGAFGIGAEIGHMRVVPGGLLCGCGNRGCFEQYASGSALVREAREAAERHMKRAEPLLDLAGGDIEKITGPLVTQAAQEGDPFAVDVFDTVGRWLGEGIASLTAVLDPGVIVIGGGVAEAGELLLKPTREAFEESLTGRGHRPIAEIRPAALANNAGFIGAADLARR